MAASACSSSPARRPPRHRRAASCGDGTGPARIEPGHDGRVVGRGVGEGGPGQPAAGGLRQRTVTLAQLGQDDGVILRRRHDAHVRMVLGRAAHHRRAADVDELNGGVGRERVEVGDHQVDGLDAVGLQVGHVAGHVAIGQDPAVDLRVEGLHPAAQHFGGARDLGHLQMGDAGVGQGGGGIAAGDQLPPEISQALGQLDQPFLVIDRQQCPQRSHLLTVHARRSRGSRRSRVVRSIGRPPARAGPRPRCPDTGCARPP